NGIYTFNIDNLQVGSLISTTGGGQIGNMIRTSRYVYAVKQAVGILVINPDTDAVVTTIPGSYHSIVQAKDGSVWTVQDQKVVNVNESTFATTNYNIPTTKYIGSWGAWNAGSFTASVQNNTLYWINSINSFVSGTQIVKFDVTNKTFNENFATLPGQTGTYKQIPYGAALRVNPVTDELILNTTESGYGTHYQNNWIHTFDNNGNLTNTKQLNDYYWFPAMAVFPDNTSPVISTTLPTQMTISGTTTIDLKTVISDTDNLSAAIVKTVKSNTNPEAVSAVINTDEELVLSRQGAGNAEIVLSFNSNGKIVEKTLSVTGSTQILGTAETQKISLSIYPNPATDLVNIRTSEKIIDVSLFDMTGRKIEVSYNNGQVNLSTLPKGIYILRATTEKAVYQQKLIKN
ncbi:DUF5074 domain-containing protein, partial [Chryseobacterium taichungense]|uniref:DUF5074 domain-containing protein n=1 Tax=Chryseobacterium taichungense TaxID=295069 RepID=UPI0028ADC594